MKKLIRKMTYEAACDYAQELFAQLEAREDYTAVCERAAGMGIEIRTAVRHTYTEEYASGYRADTEQTGRVPLGYAMELWFDLMRDGHVLMTQDGSAQCSYGAPAIDCVSVVLMHYLNIRDLAYILARNPICAMLEEFLDRIEEEGEMRTPFTGEAPAPLEAVPLGVLHRDEVASGSYAELARGMYTGKIGDTESLYVATDAFLPYRLLLHGMLEQFTPFEDATLVLDGDACDAFASILDEAASLVRHAPTFADLFMEVCESPLAPPPAYERVLDSLTVSRHRDFAADCEALSAFLREQAEAEDIVTIIW